MVDPPVDHITAEHTQVRSLSMEHFVPPNTGERLYLQGLQDQKRKALRIEKIDQQRNEQGKRLNLSTRSYTPGRHRSASAPRPILGADGLRPQSVYSRLYAMSKDRSDIESEKKLESIHSSRNMARSASRSRANGYTSVHERLYSLAKSNVEEKVPSSMRSRSQSRSRSSVQAGESASDRLYSYAMQKRVIEDERVQLKKEMEEMESNAPRTLELVAKKSYTPLRERLPIGADASVHSRLYHLHKAKKNQAKKDYPTARSNQTPKRSSKEAERGVERLYGRSVYMQEEGQKRREEIEARKSKRRGTSPSKKISIEKAVGIYERGFKKKLELEIKRETEGPIPYVSPMLNPLVPNDGDDYEMDEYRNDDGSIFRSEGPAPRAKSQTPSFYSNRAPDNPSRSRDLNGQNSRIRTRSRMRATNRNETSLLRSSTPTPRERQHARGCRVRERSISPSERVDHDNLNELLRKMENDVNFYNKMKQAVSEMGNVDNIIALEDDPASDAPYEQQSFQVDYADSQPEFDTSY